MTWREKFQEINDKQGELLKTGEDRAGILATIGTMAWLKERWEEAGQPDLDSEM